MSQKNRKGGNSSPAHLSGPEAKQAIERFIENRRFKDAMKQAKILLQREDSPENRTLLEKASVLRIEQLYQGGMHSTAAEVAGNLLETGVRNPEILRDLLRLLPALGLGTQAFTLAGRVDSPQLQQELTARTADQAVLHPEKNRSLSSELLQGAAQVRSALQALDAGQETQAFELLKDVARQSPFADWRLFVRGLAAFRRGDFPSATANWDRLDPQRSPHRIATRLRAIEQAKTAPADQMVTGVDLQALEKQVFGEPVLARLAQIDEAVREGDWGLIMRLLPGLRHTLRRVDVTFAQRLTEILVQPLADALPEYETNEFDALVRDFCRVSEPQAFDPHMNRTKAIFYQVDQGETEQAIEYWEKYFADLEEIESIPVAERQAMRAFVKFKVGDLFALLAADALDDMEEFGEDPDDDVDDDDDFYAPRILQKRAIAAFEESLTLDPTRRETYSLLKLILDDWGRPDESAELARRKLQAFPDDLDALQQLGDYHFRRDEMGESLTYYERARQLKPLDEALFYNVQNVRQGLARVHALAGRWDEGRAEWDQIDLAKLEPQWVIGHMARRAAFEFKAGETARAEDLILSQIETLAQPIVFWLELSIQAARYQLPESLQTRFAVNFQKDAAKKVVGSTAVRLADILGVHVRNGIEYTGRDVHVKVVVDYLGRAARSRFSADDYVSLCRFYSLFPSLEYQLDKTVQRAVKKYPQSPDLLVFAAKQDLTSGRFGGIRMAERRLETALTILQQPDSRRNPDLEKCIKELLTRIRNQPTSNWTLGGMGRPFPEPPGGLSGPDLDEMMDRLGEFSSPFEMMKAMMGQVLGSSKSDDDPDLDSGRPPKSRRKSK
ncbi:MAG: hypothetical protein JSS02_15460 [Planctomycetes bacterium]|nr:hypothetical protein [Planctomycetota bacterium]